MEPDGSIALPEATDTFLAAVCDSLKGQFTHKIFLMLLASLSILILLMIAAVLSMFHRLFLTKAMSNVVKNVDYYQ
jgi:hypothetical protein